MGKGKTAVVVLATGAKLAVKYGPQAKIVWDNGGKKAAETAARRARSVTARRKALTHASTIVDGSVLRVAPEGVTAYVVYSGDQSVAVHPPQERPLEELVAHADLAKRERPEAKPVRGAGRRSLPTRD